MSLNQLKEFNEQQKNAALQDYNDRLEDNQNILEQNKEELRQRVANLVEPIGTEVLRLSGERLLKKYGMKKYYDAIKSGDTQGFVKQATNDAQNKISQIVSDKADPYLKSLGLNDEQVKNFKNGDFDKLGDDVTSKIFNKANDVENNLDVRNVLSNNNFKPEEIDSVMKSDVGELLKNKAVQFQQRIPTLMDKYRNGLNNQGQAEFGKLTNNEDPSIENIGDHEAIINSLLKNPNLREAQGLVGGGRPDDVPFFSVPELAKKFEWTTPVTGGAEKDILSPEEREQFEKEDFAQDLERASRAQALGEVLPVPTKELSGVDLREPIQPTQRELFRKQIEAGERADPSKINRGGSNLDTDRNIETLSNPHVIDGSYNRGSYKVQSKAPTQAPPQDTPSGGPQSQVEDPFPITEEDLEATRPALEALRQQFPPPTTAPPTSSIQQAGQDISEASGGIMAAKQGRNLYKTIKNRGSSKQDIEPSDEEQSTETTVGTESAEDPEQPEAPQPEEQSTAPVQTTEPKTIEESDAPAEAEKTVTPELSEAEKADILSKGGTGEIADASAEDAAKLSADGAGAIFEDAGLTEAGSEGFLNPIADGVGLVTGIAGLLMGSGIFDKKPPAPPKPPPIQDTSIVSGSAGEAQI